VDLITKKVRQCYQEAPFPDIFQNSQDYRIELKSLIFWLKLNFRYLNLGEWQPKSVLCAGCGTGEEAIALAKIFPKAKITAIDISRPSLVIARKNIQTAGVKINLKKLSIYDLPDTKYDLVYCVGVIHHLSDPEKGFGVLSKTFKSKFIISVYNTYGLMAFKFRLKILSFFTNRKKWAGRLFKIVPHKAFFYDAFMNPQIKTFSIQQVTRWGQNYKLKLAAICPPTTFSGLINFTKDGSKYIVRRKVLTQAALKIAGYFGLDKIRHSSIFLTQLIYLVLGKGECFYLFKR
jgi:2-polyprenyl-3-methyl-5-hydroxy-6-metoxy-1,4-benzoquinol methylase